MACTFDYGYSKVRDLYAVAQRPRKSAKATISAIMVQGQEDGGAEEGGDASLRPPGIVRID